jgi:hypothetical protein
MSSNRWLTCYRIPLLCKATFINQSGYYRVLIPMRAARQGIQNKRHRIFEEFLIN